MYQFLILARFSSFPLYFASSFVSCCHRLFIIRLERLAISILSLPLSLARAPVLYLAYCQELFGTSLSNRLTARPTDQRKPSCTLPRPPCPLALPALGPERVVCFWIHHPHTGARGLHIWLGIFRCCDREKEHTHTRCPRETARYNNMRELHRASPVLTPPNDVAAKTCLFVLSFALEYHLVSRTPLSNRLHTLSATLPSVLQSSNFSLDHRFHK